MERCLHPVRSQQADRDRLPLVFAGGVYYLKVLGDASTSLHPVQLAHCALGTWRQRRMPPAYIPSGECVSAAGGSCCCGDGRGGPTADQEPSLGAIRTIVVRDEEDFCKP